MTNDQISFRIILIGGFEGSSIFFNIRINMEANLFFYGAIEPSYFFYIFIIEILKKAF